MTMTQEILQSSNLHQRAVLTVGDISRALDIEKPSVRRWISQGSLKGEKLGSRLFVKTSDFKRFLDNIFQDEHKEASNE